MTHYRILLLTILTLTLTIGKIQAQEDTIREVRHYDYCDDIIASSNQLYRIVIACNTGRLATWKDILVTNTKPATAISLNPSGSNFAIGTDKLEIELWSLETRNLQLGKLKGHTAPIRVLDYSRDTRYLLSAGMDKTVRVWDIKTLTLYKHFPCLHPVNAACFSPNGYYFACDQANDIVIFNYTKSKAVLGLSGHTAPIAKMKFSDDGKYLMSLDTENNIIVWNVADSKIYRKIKIPGTIKDADIHHNNKYLATIDTDGKLLIWNLKTLQLQQTQTSQKTGKTVQFSYDYDKQKALLTHCDQKNCYIWDVERLEPAFDILAATTHDQLMNLWNRKRNNETSDQYSKRLNDSLQQKSTATMTQVITELGLQWRPIGKPTRSPYNPEQGAYTLTFDKIKPFLLKIDREDTPAFELAFDKCQYSKPIYGLDMRDLFSLENLEIYNPENKKTYYYGNTVTHKKNPKKIVTGEIVKKIGEEEVILKQQLKNYFDKEIAQQRISDNVKVNVEAKPRESIGEDGQSVVDYCIDYSYEVLKTEKTDIGDWAPGRYMLAQSNAATASVKIIKQTFEKELAQYIKPGKNITVKVTGSADASPILKPIKYDGVYGDFDRQSYYLNGNIDNISISIKQGVTTNSQLAFLRTYGVRHFIEQEIEPLQKTNNTFEHHVFVSEERGNQYRRVSIEVIIHDAFRK